MIDLTSDCPNCGHPHEKMLFSMAELAQKKNISVQTLIRWRNKGWFKKVYGPLHGLHMELPVLEEGMALRGYNKIGPKYEEHITRYE